MKRIENVGKNILREEPDIKPTLFTIWSLCMVLVAIVGSILASSYHVEDLEYANVDFEWVDDFGNYEIVISHEDKPHYLTVKDDKVKLIYANEDFLNFVIVGHNKKIINGESEYEVKSFYINLNYKEIEDEIY